MKEASLIFRGLFLLTAGLILGCKSGPFNLIKPATPHEQYERKLINAGLAQSAMGAAWLQTAEQSLQNAVQVNLPYQEKGYFGADKVEAVTFKFKLIRGEKLRVDLVQKPAGRFKIYLDVWLSNESAPPKFLAAADTLTNSVELAASQTSDYLLRIQPELLAGMSYTLSIAKGPSLSGPLKSLKRSQIQSFYGAGRDENTRKHEGVDIFAPFRTPVVAAAGGTVTGVGQNNLGGKVVWLRPEQENYTLYYAHLDEQLVTQGQRVAKGDTLGLVGNTGNAKTTPPHLHFGIYTSGGAIDPLPFIDPLTQELPVVNAATTLLHSTMRNTAKVTIGTLTLPRYTIMRINAASGNNYRIALPDGKVAFLPARSLAPATAAVSSLNLKDSQEVYDQPIENAAVRSVLSPGQKIEILGSFEAYQLIRAGQNDIGWIRK